jgi:DNA-binding CsgD family transcriptional regulator
VGAGLTTKEIAEKFHLSARTVDVHRLNIKRKLGCGTFADVLAKAMAYKRREDEAGRLPAPGSPGE